MVMPYDKSRVGKRAHCILLATSPEHNKSSSSEVKNIKDHKKGSQKKGITLESCFTDRIWVFWFIRAAP